MATGQSGGAAPAKSTSAALLAALLLLLLASSAALAPAPAPAGTGEEAARQLQLAEDDLTAGQFERAAASAASALRLDPSLHEALVVRALALKGLGRLEDAAALLRAYKDLRGTLPADERVAPALIELERLLAAQSGPAGAHPPPSVSVEPAAGPVILFYAPDRPSAAEDAWAAANPFLGDAPPVAVLPLKTILPAPGEGLLTFGAPATHCSGGDLQGELEEQLAAAELAAEEMDPEASDAATANAELHLACGGTPVGPAVVARLLAARAAGRWVAGEPEVAGRLWSQAFTIEPERAVDASLSPTATALQLSAKSRADQEPVRGRIDFVLPAGWGAWIDGRAVEVPVAAVPRGRRLVRVMGPNGEAAGAVLTVAEGTVLATTADGLLRAAESPAPGDVVLRWLTAPIEDFVGRNGAVAGLVVNLEAEPASVRRFEAGGWLLLNADLRRAGTRVTTRGEAGRGGPRPGSLALLGGGLAAAAVGVIVAAVSHRDGLALTGEMGTGRGFTDNYAAYEGLRTRERVGAGIAIGGGVLAGVGVVMFVIPTRTDRSNAKAEVGQ